MLSKLVQRKYTLKNWVLNMSILIKMCRQNVIFFVRLFEPYQTETRKILDEWESNRTLEKKIKVTTPTRLGKVLTKIYLIPSSWTKEMWSLFFFFYFQVEVLNKSSIHSNQHHNQKIRNRTRHLLTTPNTQHSIESTNAESNKP